MPVRSTFIFNMVTVPSNAAYASAHAGGWTESFWSKTLDSQQATFEDNLGLARAKCLPATATITGIKRAIFTIAGNKLLPGGASTRTVRFPGVSSFATDVPQMSIQCGAGSPDGPNSSRFALRCFPDQFVDGGEYTAANPMFRNLNAFLAMLNRDQWAFLGRVLTNATARIQSIANNVLVTSFPLGAVVGDYVRLLKCRNLSTFAVRGAFRITAIAAGNAYTLAGLPQGTEVLNSGLARLDSIDLFNFSIPVVKRVSVRKIGRPSESYRGRASRRR
jgi:hypothetical protein